MIDTENLTRRFGNVNAVEGVTLHVDEGEVFGFLGPNGAGKTTTVRMLSCLISITSGKAAIGEYDVGKKEDQPRIRRMIGLLTENAGLYDELSAYENLDFYGRYYSLSEQKRKDQIERVLKMMDLWEKRNEPAGTFSKGMKQKLAIARALIHDPRVLFLDEPTANLDPEASKTVRDFILELKKERRTIFLNTHLLDEAERICDRVAILKTKLIAMGSPANLRRSLSGRKIKIQLRFVDDAISGAVERLGFHIAERTANSLIVDVEDPEEDSPAIIQETQAAGGRIQSVTEVGSTLEDIYLKLVREAD